MIRTYRLENGLSVVAEQMDSVQSVALSILVPFGAAHDPRGLEGQASIISEMFNKGAGQWDARALSQQFEDIGVERGVSTGVEATVFSAALLPENLSKAIDLLGIMILQPSFPCDELESVVQLALQDLLALEDNPGSKVMVELSKLYYAHPWGASQLGTADGIKAVTPDSIRAFYKDFVLPGDSIIGVAGKFEWDELEQAIARTFSSWTGRRPRLLPPIRPSSNKTLHVARETSQCHIALAYPSVSGDHPDYYAAQLGVNILSGGMSGRLFVEVREKRGLVYTVSASHAPAKGRGAVMAHAGTTPERAEETLRVMYQELCGLARGITKEELERARIDLKSRVVMRGELPSARGPAIVSDWWNLGRVRPLGEIKAEIERVSVDDVVRYAEEYPVRNFSLVSLGKTDLGKTDLG